MSVWCFTVQCDVQSSVLLCPCSTVCRVQAGLLAYCALVAVSRVADNKHHATDVVAGALLGAAVALLALVRATPRSCSSRRGEETELRTQAQGAGSLSLVTEDRA